MWHFLKKFWRCDHFFCGSLVLEVMPDQRSIGVWCCNLRFRESKHCAAWSRLIIVLVGALFWWLYAVRCFDQQKLTEPRIAAPNTNGSLIWNNFQDQTSTAKVAISPKNIGKMPQNLLKKIFWKINFIKMIKILICVLK